MMSAQSWPFWSRSASAERRSRRARPGPDQDASEVVASLRVEDREQGGAGGRWTSPRHER